MDPVKHLIWKLSKENNGFELTLANYFCKKFNYRCLKGSRLIKYFRIHESKYQFWNYQKVANTRCYKYPMFTIVYGVHRDIFIVFLLFSRIVVCSTKNLQI